MLKKRIKNTSLVIALILTSFTAGLNIHPFIANASDSGFGLFLRAYDILSLEYLNGINNEKLVQGAIKGMIKATGDPYTRYLSPEDYKKMTEEIQGSFTGIGIQIGIRNKNNKNELTIISSIENSPASKSDLQSGDIILEINNNLVKDLSVDQAVDLIKGIKGTAVNLKIYRESIKKVLEKTIIRDNITPIIVKSKILENKIGYISLSTFMNHEASNEIKNAINNLKKNNMKALIFDLRGNPGGLLTNAINISNMFIKSGSIVQIVDKKGEKEYINASGKIELPLETPIALLVDEGSASASEIVSGALKDNNRAILIGTKTFGKGLVQSTFNLDDGSGIVITTNKYLTPNGTDINKKGIEPNIVVEIPKNIQTNISKPFNLDKNDTQLKKALVILREKIKEN